VVGVIGKVGTGADVGGLVGYLLGPGRSDEHTDQRVIGGSWPDMTLVTGGDAIASRAELTRWLSAWDRTAQQQWGRAPAKVWHLSLSLPAADGQLSDEQWRQAAETVMERVGLHGGDAAGGGVRWAAIHHGPSSGGNDHIHIAAVLVDQLGTPRVPFNDYLKVRDACRELEARWGLTVTAKAQDGGPTPPTRAETERAARDGQPVPPRVRMECEVRAAAAMSTNFTELQQLLAGRGITARGVHIDASGNAHGVVFTDPTYVNRAAEPIEFSGKALAPDLTLPKLQDRWASGQQAPVLAATEQVLRDAAARIDAGGADAAATVWATADHLAAVAVHLEPDTPGGRLHQAARAVARTAKATPNADASVRSASASLAFARVLRSGRSDLQVLMAARALLASAARLRAAQQRLVEAQACERAAQAVTTASITARSQARQEPGDGPTPTPAPQPTKPGWTPPPTSSSQRKGRRR
jgi:hypothetical protein